jgi:hypothetical protein
MITLHDDVIQGTQEWLEARKGMYTGSNALKLLTSSDSSKIINGERSGYATGDINNFKGNFYTKRGHLLETEALKLYEKITGNTVTYTGYVTNSLYTGCLYSPDGLEPDCVLEVKAFTKDKHLELLSGKIPDEIMAQIHYGMLIYDVKRARLIPYNPEFAKRDNDFYDPKKAIKIIDVKANPRILTNFRNKLKKELAHA